MQSSEEKKLEPVGNGLNLVEILKAVGRSMVTALLPLLAAKAASLLERKLAPKSVPKVESSDVLDPRGADPVPVARVSSDRPPLPPLTKLPERK